MPRSSYHYWSPSSYSWRPHASPYASPYASSYTTSYPSRSSSRPFAFPYHPRPTFLHHTDDHYTEEDCRAYAMTLLRRSAATSALQYCGPPSESDMQEHIDTGIKQIRRRALRLTVDRCAMSVSNSSRGESKDNPCSHGVDCSKCNCCTTCGWLVLLHRNADGANPRPACGEFFCETLLIPFIRRSFRLLHTLCQNDERLRDLDDPTGVSVLCFLQKQLELAEEEPLGSGTTATDVRVYRNAYLPEGTVHMGANFAVKYPRTEEEQDKIWHEATLLTMCETINRLRVPFLAGLVYDEDTRKTGLAIHRIKGVTLQKFATDLNAEEHSPSVLVGIMHELAKTVAALHQHRIYHDDLKRDNIIIASHHFPYVIDFGQAATETSSSPLTAFRPNPSGQMSDLEQLHSHIELLFPHIDDRRPRVQRTLPPCIVKGRAALGKHNRKEQEYTARQLSDSFANCTCQHHDYRSQVNFEASLITPEVKTDLAKMACMMSENVHCAACISASHGTGGDPWLLEAL